MTQTLKFYSFLPDLTKDTQIAKASAMEFEWLKKAFEDYKANNINSHTSKCPGIISIMNSGYIQKTYQDVHITTKYFSENDGGFKWHSSINQKALHYGNILNDYVSCHAPDQLYKFKLLPQNTLPSIVKIQSPWFVEIPKGYSLLSMPIPYGDTNNFTAATGILKGNNFLNVQLYWHCLEGTIHIKKGTPLCQYILIKDEHIECEIKTMDTEDQFLSLYKNNKNYTEIYNALKNKNN